MALQPRRVVGHQAEVDDLHPQALQRTEQAGAVAVVDAAWRQRLPRVAQLVAGRKQRHPQAAKDAQAVQAQRRRQAQVGRAQHPALRQRHPAARQVFAALAPVLAGAQHAGGNRHRVAVDLAQFDRHHRVQPGRHHRAGHDADALAAPHRAAVGRAGEHRVAGRAQDGRQGSGRFGGQVGAVQGVAVHRRVVVCRHVDRRDHVGRQHPAKRRGDRHDLGLGDRAQRRGDGGARRVDRQFVAGGQRGRS